jgi:hypothetical protein
VADEVIDYVPSARPGNRAPHIWLERAGKRCSMLDLFGPGFTLLAGRAGGGWLEAAAAARAHFRLELSAHAIGGDGEWTDTGGGFAERYGIGEDGAVLVRPDGHVALRVAGGSPAKTFDPALRKLLACPAA